MLKKRLFGMMTLMVGVILVFCLVGCDDGSKDDGNGNPFAGTWTQDGTGGAVKVVLTSSTWTARYNNSVYNEGTYTYEGSTATWTVTNKGMGSAVVGATGSASISNGKMVVSNFSDNAMNGTYSK